MAKEKITTVGYIPTRTELLDGAKKSNIIILLNKEMRSTKESRTIEKINAKHAANWNILSTQTVGKETY